MKKKLFSLVIIFALFVIKSTNAIEYKTSSEHWSLLKNGPTSNEQAIEMFFKNRYISPYEGIWMEGTWGKVAIVKDGPNSYKKYVIDVLFSDLNGTHETTYYKTAKKGQLSFYTRIVWKNGKSYKYATSTGDLYWKDINTLQREIHRYAKNSYAEFNRVWPFDYVKHNEKYLVKKDKTKKTFDTSKVNETKNLKDYWWVVVLLALGTFFLYTMTVKKPKINFMKKKKSKQRGRIAKYWAGEDSLAFSFWGVSTLGLTLFQLPNFIILSQGDAVFDTMSDITTLIYALYIIIFFIVAIIAYVGCWRSAAKYIKMKNKIKKSTFWGYTTYVVIALSTLRVFTALVTGN